MTDSLDDIRQAIDEVDRRLLGALADRHRIIERVAALKAAHRRPVRDPARERDLLDALAADARDVGLSDAFVTNVFAQILDHSVRVQEERLGADHAPVPAGDALTVAYQGVEGAYSHAAVRRHYASRSGAVRAHGYLRFSEAVAAVTSGDADTAVLPVENTTAGPIVDVFDLLGASDVHVIGEEVVPIKHCLIGLEPVPDALLRRVYSHPAALAQCGRFLASLPNARPVNYHDTAYAVEKVRDDGDPAQAAIASEEAARRYGLPILRTGIADAEENYTRFLVIARAPTPPPVDRDCKTTLTFTATSPHAVAHALGVFGAHGVPVTHLVCRPQPDAPWHYRFFLDVAGHPDQAPLTRALDALHTHTDACRVLGTFTARPHPSAR